MAFERKSKAQRLSLHVDRTTRVLEADGTIGIWEPGPDELESALVRYIALVSELRGDKEQSKFKIRREDLEVLAETFELDIAEVRRRVEKLQMDSRVLVSRRTFRRQPVPIPRSGLMLVVTPVGALMLGPEGGDTALAV